MRGPPVTEEQVQERFWRRRLDGIGLDTVTKEFRAIEFKRTQDASSNYAERATAIMAVPYTGLFIAASCNSRSSHGQYTRPSTEHLQYGAVTLKTTGTGL
jgi:hypothetical protein